ncbi:hypothetical protein KCP70_09570 [Salmonella enterica subsp. enterica]|nr:hypothetical protein KCP70_09570 [Salmonella enterica subsp. enterica]
MLQYAERRRAAPVARRALYSAKVDEPLNIEGKTPLLRPMVGVNGGQNQLPIGSKLAPV